MGEYATWPTRPLPGRKLLLRGQVFPKCLPRFGFHLLFGLGLGADDEDGSLHLGVPQLLLNHGHLTGIDHE
jgi:hypothetical protein